MKRINLKNYYPYYMEDCIIEVTDELESFLRVCKAREKAYKEKIRYNKAYYSLEWNNNVDNDGGKTSISAEEEFERRLAIKELYLALNGLSDIQMRRVYAYYFLGMNQSEIAKAEGTKVPAISKSIDRGLKKMKKQLKKTLYI